MFFIETIEAIKLKNKIGVVLILTIVKCNDLLHSLTQLSFGSTQQKVLSQRYYVISRMRY